MHAPSINVSGAEHFQMLVDSFAPSIVGHRRIKVGLLLMLLGGVGKYNNATPIRG
jgi:DNA replicative helicase MCM subunit Mcm2 (Cdc46/Mcm family)